MGDYAQVDDVAVANIAQINDVPYANCSQINDCTKAASGATKWCGVHLDREKTYASNSDLTSWSVYDSNNSGSPTGSTDPYYIAYGKDALDGNPRWCATLQNVTDELVYTDDPTNENAWTVVTTLRNGSSDITMKLFVIEWGNGYWMAAGDDGDTLLRADDGALWDEVDVSGATSINSGKAIYALISDGAGNWWFAQENRIYKSTNDGASFSLHHTLLDAGGSDPGYIRGFTYTNNTLVALCKSTGDMFAAASSDTTDWSNETTLTSVGNFGQQTRIASAGGRVVIAYNLKYWAADVSGKSITLEHNNASLPGSHGNARCISTDGSTWVVGCSDGDVVTSTDGGDNWSISATNVATSNLEMRDNAPDVHLPL